MTRPDPYDPDMPLDELMRLWPQAIALALRHGLLCVGCAITPFHTIADACREHGLDEDAFAAELRAAGWFSDTKDGRLLTDLVKRIGKAICRHPHGQVHKYGLSRGGFRVKTPASSLVI